MARGAIAAACLLMLAHHASAQSTQSSDYAALSAGLVGSTVNTASFMASRIALTGSQALSVVVNDVNLPVVAAQRFGSGRFVQFGHESMVDQGPTASIFKLVLNAAAWASGKASGITLAGSGSYGSRIAARLANVSARWAPSICARAEPPAP